jgi:hypothetical protein
VESKFVATPICRALAFYNFMIGLQRAKILSYTFVHLNWVCIKSCFLLRRQAFWEGLHVVLRAVKFNQTVFRANSIELSGRLRSGSACCVSPYLSISLYNTKLIQTVDVCLVCSGVRFSSRAPISNTLSLNELPPAAARCGGQQLDWEQLN